ncbi:hypothetical protein PGB90_006125 [Kerria lacca]
MSSSNDSCSCTEEKQSATNATGVRLFKTIVRKVRQTITEAKLLKSSSFDDISSIVFKMNQMSTNDSDNPDSSVQARSSRKLFSSLRANTDEKSRSGFSSDSGNEKTLRNSKIRKKQKIRGRSKSDSKRIEKRTKKILRSPPTYVYVRGLSGIPTQRVRVN